MTQSSKYLLSSALLAVLAGTAGCVADNAESPVLIMYNYGSSYERDSAGSGVDSITRGLVDTQWGAGYAMYPVVRNFAETSKSVDELQRIAFIEGADIRLELDDGFSVDSSLTGFSIPVSAVVEPDGGTTTLGLEIVPYALLAEMDGSISEVYGRSLIKATITLFGTLGGGPISTQDYVYWVEVCNGCAPMTPSDV